VEWSERTLNSTSIHWERSPCISAWNQEIFLSIFGKARNVNDFKNRCGKFLSKFSQICLIDSWRTIKLVTIRKSLHWIGLSHDKSERLNNVFLSVNWWKDVSFIWLYDGCLVDSWASLIRYIQIVKLTNEDLEDTY
jgi:hypothetical protein